MSMWRSKVEETQSRVKESQRFDDREMARLEHLMQKIEAGQPYGDQCDIDLLMEEVVKRLERRLVAKIDDILDRVPDPITCNACTTSSTPSTSRGTSPAPSRGYQQSSRAASPAPSVGYRQSSRTASPAPSVGYRESSRTASPAPSGGYQQSSRAASPAPSRGYQQSSRPTSPAPSGGYRQSSRTTSSGGYRQSSRAASPAPSGGYRQFSTSASSPRGSPQQVRKISKKTKSMLEPNMELLEHEAQEIVENIIMTAMESVMDLNDAELKKQTDRAFPFRPTRVEPETHKKSKSSWLYHVQDESNFNKTPQPYSKPTDEEYQDMSANPFRPSRIAALNKKPAWVQKRAEKAKKSIEKPQLYQEMVDEEGDDDDVFVTPPTSLHEVRPILKSAKIVRQETMPSTSSKQRPQSSPQQHGVIHTDAANLNPTYTYILRNSVQRSIPKYLSHDKGQSRAAIMHMFNDIRYTMADENVEGMITYALEKAFYDNEATDGSKGGSYDANQMADEDQYYDAQSEGQTQQSSKDTQRQNYGKKIGTKEQPETRQAQQGDNSDQATDGKTSPWQDPIGQDAGDESSIRHDSNLNYLVRRALRRAVPKYTQNKLVSGALLQLADKMMDEVPIQQGSLSLTHDDTDFTSSDKHDKETMKEVPKPSKNVSSKKRPEENLPCVSKGKGKASTPTRVNKGKIGGAKPSKPASKGSQRRDVTTSRAEDLPWESNSRYANNIDDECYAELTWVKKGETATSSKVSHDSSTDMPCVRKGITHTPRKVDKKRTTIPVSDIQSRMAVATQTSLRALCEDCEEYPYSVTAGGYYNTNTNQSAGCILVRHSSESLHEEIFYDAPCWPSDLQITEDHQDGNMSLLKRFRLNLLFRKKQKKQEKKFVSAVHKVIEARRSGCIDDDGNFVTSIPTPAPVNDGDKSPPPTKPKPNKSLDKNGNKRDSKKKRGSSKRRKHPANRDSYPLPEEDDGSEGYASASEMDDFNPTAFLERNRRSAENTRLYDKDDGEDADVESDSDGANSSNRRVRFSDDVQHFGDIVALGGVAEGSSDDLDADDDQPDMCLLSLKSKIELFEKVGSNEFLDERSLQGSPPPDLPPENSTLPTKDRVKLFEDISCGKKPTTSAATHKTPRRAVDSCQFTHTQSKISFFEELNNTKNTPN